MGFINKTNTITKNEWNTPEQKKDTTQAQTSKSLACEYEGAFVGSEMKGQGVIKQGKKQGQTWTRLRLNFVKGTIENQKNIHFSCFIPLVTKNGKGLQPNELEFGKEYKVLYNENRYTNEHGDQVGKTAFMILPLFQDKIQQSLQTQSTVKTPVNILQQPIKQNDVLPKHKQVWDNNNFGFEAEWMQIAEQSGVFDSEEEAKKVFDILSKQ